MKDCELCSYPARMFCESDQASLCWDCDEKVHGANFLVARHSRSLLCHVCQSPTPWKASGLKFGHTVSVCENCVKNCGKEHERSAEEEESHGRNDEDEDDDDDDDDEEDDFDEDEDGEYTGGDDDDEDEDEDGEEGENQVVPWSCTPPPPVACSSSSEAESTGRFCGGGVSALKRTRETADLDSDDDIGCSSSERNYKTMSTALTLGTSATAAAAAAGDEATSLSSFKPLKLPRTTELSRSRSPKLEDDHKEKELKPAAIISSLKRFQQSRTSDNDSSATIHGIRKLSRDPRTIDLD